MTRDRYVGGQSQVFHGLVRDIEQAQPPCWLCIDPDSDIFREIKRVSPHTVTLARIYTGAPTVDDKNQHPDPYKHGFDYATLVFSRLKDPANTDFLLYENEPNDHYGNLTEFIRRLNASLVGFSDRARQLGFKPVGPNFSTGYPEVFAPSLTVSFLEEAPLYHNREELAQHLINGGRGRMASTRGQRVMGAADDEYVLWEHAWSGLTDGLRALKSVGGALGLHEYSAPSILDGWSDGKQLGYLTGRHKAAYRCLPPDLQDLEMYLTEFFIDWLVIGQQGGFWHNRNPETVIQWAMQQMRMAWDRIYRTTPQLRGACVFIHGNNSPNLWEEYDTTRTDECREAFVAFMQERLTPSIDPVPPTPPEPPQPPPAGVIMVTPEQIRAELPASIAKALEWDLGQHLYGEWEVKDNTGKPHYANMFDKGGVLAFTENGVWKYKFFDRKTFALSDAPTVVTPPPANNTAYKFPQVLTDIGAVGEQGVPLEGQPFYRLTGASVRRGISAFAVVTVFANGAPKVGAKVVNLFPDGNGEVVETDGSGNARFQFGASSAFTNPGTGPFTMFVADDTAFKDFDAIPKRVVFQYHLSDIVKSLGDFQGEHTEIYLQFIEM